MDDSAARRPLAQAADPIRRLDEYDTTQDLAAAIIAVVAALDEAVRIRLRNDPGASEDHRLSAFSRQQLPFDEVVKSLRTRDLISLETAGTLHEAQGAAERASAGEVRAADADVVRMAVDRLRDDLDAGAPPSPEPQDAEVDGKAPDEAGEPVRTSDRGGRWMRWIAAVFAAAILAGAAWVAMRGANAEYDAAMAAFRAERYDSAAAGFEGVLDEWPENVTAMLYLARTYRRLERPSDAAGVLRRALEIEPQDGDVRRELGHLFMDLSRPESAVPQYERALEYEPDDPLNWAALIRALRQLEDPRAEQLLRDAPAEVQAALRGA